MPPSGNYIFILDIAIYPPRIPHSSLSCVMHSLSEVSPLHVTWNTRTMYHARLGGFGFDVVPSWVNCKNRYNHRSWWDDEWDEEGLHMLEYFVTAWWTHQAYQVIIERNTCIKPSRNTKTIEDPAPLCHVEEACEEYIHHLVGQKLHMDTTVNHYMLAISCRIVSWVSLAMSPLWAISIVTECNLNWIPINAHNNSKSHLSWKFMGSWITLPFYEQGIFTLAPPT